MINRGVILLCASVFVLCLSAHSLGYAQEVKSLAGVPGTVFVHPKGELRVGNTTIWTKGGLEVGIVKYDSNPNSTGMEWASVSIKLTDGNRVGAKGIETVHSRNFIILLVEPEHKIVWIPFRAIESMRLSKVDSRTLKKVTVQGDVYGWFRFEGESYDIGDIAMRAEVSLVLPDTDGTAVVRGWFLDSPGDLVLFGENGSEDIPWMSVLELTIAGNEVSSTKSDGTVFTRRLIYRTTERWSNVWKEYSIPSEGE
jgi:hypothetical protein